MPSSHPRDARRWLLPWALALTLVTGCSTSHHRAAGPTTTLLAVDDWKAPIVSGPPGPASFCTVLVAMFSHQTLLPVATTEVKRRILADFVSTVPEALAAAPADIAPAARTYLGALAPVLTALATADFDYQKVPPATLAPLLLDPGVRAAGNQVLAYSSTDCHYTIGAVPTRP